MRDILIPIVVVVCVVLVPIFVVIASQPDPVVVSIKTVDTYTEGLYLDTDRGMFRCCDNGWCESEIQDQIILKHNALADRSPKRLTFCNDHNEVLSVDFVESVEPEKKADREIVYKEITPEGITLSALLSSLGIAALSFLAVLLGAWGGYRIGRAGR